MSLDMLKANSNASKRAPYSVDCPNQISMIGIAGGNPLDLLYLMEGTQIVAANKNRARGNCIEWTEAFNG